MLDISKKCDQQCPISTYNSIAISSRNVEYCPDSIIHSTVSNIQPENEFKDFCRVGKDCLMANNSKIDYQQCYSSIIR